MEISGKLDVEFFNYYEDRAVNPKVDPVEYLRVDGTWNIYFHGFYDRYDDIAYVKVPTVIQPGIYEVSVRGIECYLFYWQSTDRKRGLIVRKADPELIEEAYQKYLKQAAYI